MTPGERLQASSAKVVNKFANKGWLLEPKTDDYNPLEGKVEYNYSPHSFEWVTVDNKSLPKDSALKVASLRQSLIWFTSADLAVDRSWGIIPEDKPDGIPRDIVGLEKVIVNDVIVGYYALLEYKED